MHFNTCHQRRQTRYETNPSGEAACVTQQDRFWFRFLLQRSPEKLPWEHGVAGDGSNSKTGPSNIGFSFKVTINSTRARSLTHVRTALSLSLSNSRVHSYTHVRNPFTSRLYEQE